MSMVIKFLECDNIKRVKAVRIDPTTPLVIIGGNNAQGKTSVIDAIEFALGGKSRVPSEPVRRGERKAHIVVDMTDIVVKRTFADDGGTTLIVESKDGARFNRPQDMLDKLVGTLSFDPHEFIRLPMKDQAKLLRELVGIDFTDLDQQRKDLYEERTLVNRQVKQAEGGVASAAHHPNAPSIEVDVAKVSQELQAAINTNGSADSAERNQSSAADRCKEIDEEVARLEGSIATLKAERETKASIASGQANPVARIDLAPIQAKLHNAEAINRQVRDNANRVTLKKQLDQHIAKSSEISTQIDSIDRVKGEMLAEAKFPVAGLSFNDDGVLLNGLPFDQASGAEQLRTSVAMGLALNPQLKVLLVRDGSLLDENSMAILKEMAEKSEAQVWLERVGEGAECSVVIEDGMVKESTNSKSHAMTA